MTTLATRWANLIAAVGVVLILAGLLLPRLHQLREYTRQVRCQINLSNIGIALQQYHDQHSGFPPGYFPVGYKVQENGSVTWPAYGPSYGWATFLLPQLDYQELADELSIVDTTLEQILLDRTRMHLVETALPLFRCSSDPSGDSIMSAPVHCSLVTGGGHYGATSNYVANGGCYELKYPLSLPVPKDLNLQSRTGPGNGVFNVASRVHVQQISDGLSHTIAVGERAWFQGSSTWVGTCNVGGGKPNQSGVCLGRVFWHINEVPAGGDADAHGSPAKLITPQRKEIITRENTSRNGFGSYHPGGAYFLIADGSVRFISEQVDHHNTIARKNELPQHKVPNAESLGVFQRLGIGNDGQSVSREELN